MFDRIIKFFTEMRKREIEQGIEMNKARFEEHAKKNAQRIREATIEAVKVHNQRIKEETIKLRRTFTTIEEYKKIAGNKCSLLDKLPQHERDLVAQRVQKLCKEDEKFRKDLMAWAKQNYELPKRTSSRSLNNKQTSDILEI